ncbi:hypothetical protein ACFOLK_04300 [Marinococcus halophilus]|uniref:hypothetical protein n=1 Tax=Marinococcus halophilus TaxID=1371 RepID=UPI00117E9DA8|nr:hypothetical protein [Marinococcus halophilus]
MERRAEETCRHWLLKLDREKRRCPFSRDRHFPAVQSSLLLGIGRKVIPSGWASKLAKKKSVDARSAASEKSVRSYCKYVHDEIKNELDNKSGLPVKKAIRFFILTLFGWKQNRNFHGMKYQDICL